MEQVKRMQGMMGLVLIAMSLLTIGCAGARRSPQQDMDLRLIRAAEAGQTEEVKRLIRAGADINAMDEAGWTPYLAASSMGRLEAMRILKALGARTSVYEGPIALQ
jgi:ankyrin repeat protein